MAPLFSLHRSIHIHWPPALQHGLLETRQDGPLFLGWKNLGFPQLVPENVCEPKDKMDFSSPPRGMLKSTKSLWSWCMKQCFPTRSAPTQLWLVGCFQANLQAHCAFWGSKTYSLGICRGWNVCPPNNLYPGSFEFLLADEQPQFHVFHIHRSCTWVICVK